MSDNRNDEIRWPVWWPLFAVLLVSFLIRQYDLDRRISALFYDPIHQKWPYHRAEPWLFFYRYGRFPPMMPGLIGIVIALFGHRISSLNPFGSAEAFRRRGLFLALMFVIGPGLLVESGLKSFWGRPRPQQCQEFGGDLTFVPVGNWSNQVSINSSFPSGHAAVAFYLMSLGFIVSPNHPRLRRNLFLGGFGYGVAMSITRVMQGGHFASDVIWAGLIVYLVGVGLDRLILRDHNSELS